MKIKIIIIINMNNYYQQGQIPIQQKSSNKIVIVIVIFILLILLGIGGYFLYKNIYNGDENGNENTNGNGNRNGNGNTNGNATGDGVNCVSNDDTVWYPIEVCKECNKNSYENVYVRGKDDSFIIIRITNPANNENRLAWYGMIVKGNEIKRVLYAVIKDNQVFDLCTNEKLGDIIISDITIQMKNISNEFDILEGIYYCVPVEINKTIKLTNSENGLNYNLTG